MTDVQTPGTDAENRAFIAPVAMENDPDALFAGDRGTLDAEVRRVLVRILQRRFLLAENSPVEWKLLLEHQQMIESRLNDLFVRLVVDHARGVAYKEQVRSDELDVPILLKDEAYSRAETLVLVYLRTVFQRETTAGTASARVDVEEVEQTVLTYFSESDGTRASQQRAVRTAIARLDREGIIEEESEGRFRIGPLIEIVLSAETLRELQKWLDEQTQDAETPAAREPELPASGAPGDRTADPEASPQGDAPASEAPGAGTGEIPEASPQGDAPASGAPGARTADPETSPQGDAPASGVPGARTAEISEKDLLS
ncbi:DUF4194 domain-containing protein [Microbacterium proteolyticum]|uniref:DUF4194 domain-containing protein n=1 Tax=Microbacterium TaxID=33882 RepID=UPI00277DC37E|nr:hypothetical protein [Microbacterium sp. SORGH_AS_0344]MDQ1171135.1 hypothetical protein [Microbacterium proteolyticum]